MTMVMTNEPQAHTKQDVADCLQAFTCLANKNTRVNKLLKSWRRLMLVEASDLDARFWMTVEDGRVEMAKADVAEPLPREPAVHLRATAATLRDVFSGQRNAAQAFLAADLEVFASDGDQTKLEATCMILWGA
jgi:hypothetical protein